MDEKSYLVVGLGNIGPEYAHTRHNIGFMILDAWAQASNVIFETRRYGDMAVLPCKGRNFYLLKPSTYVNLSGNAVRYWLQKLPITEAQLIVVCDDLNLPFGTLRLRPNGRDGGHNGLANIIEAIQTQQFARIRVGIGHDFQQGGQIDFVIGDFPPEEAEMIPELSQRVIQGIKDWAFAGMERAMNSVNTKKKEL